MCERESERERERDGKEEKDIVWHYSSTRLPKILNWMQFIWEHRSYDYHYTHKLTNWQTHSERIEKENRACAHSQLKGLQNSKTANQWIENKTRNEAQKKKKQGTLIAAPHNVYACKTVCVLFHYFTRSQEIPLIFLDFFFLIKKLGNLPCIFCSSAFPVASYIHLIS